jgi:hypothetical protein
VPMGRDTKPQPNRRLYIETLRAMTSEQRIAKAFELSEMTRDLLRAGLRARYPDASEEELHRFHLRRLQRCRNRAY